jgi:hypothetical protein
MSEAAFVTRGEFQDLWRRVEAIDTVGSRGVAVVGVQVQELTKDVAKLETQLEQHRTEHVLAEQARISGRRWLIAAIIAAVAAVDGPMVTILLSVKH